MEMYDAVTQLRAITSNIELLNAGARLSEVWIPEGGSNLVIDVFRHELACGPPSFEGVVFESGTPVQSFRAAHLMVLHHLVVKEWSAFHQLRRMPQEFAADA